VALDEVTNTSSVETPTAFSEILQSLVGQEHSEVVRLAKHLQVAEVTVHRWMRGSSQPRPIHLQKMLDAFPTHYQELFQAIQQTFPGVLHSSITHLQEIQKDLYRRVMEIQATISQVEVRRWQITQTIFDYALLQLDADQQGIAITYAQLMPPRLDGIHSLCEVMSYGSTPWSYTTESRIFLGGTTLAGFAAMNQRMLTWDILDTNERMLAEIDEYERSACACPVTRGNQLSGVLIVSSTQPDFFIDPIACQSVVEYAWLLGLAFRDEEFYRFSTLSLRAFPAIKWQRAEIAHSYMPRVIAIVSQRGISRHEAEGVVRMEMEEEFEHMVRNQK
jgi:hypothetical protein